MEVNRDDTGSASVLALSGPLVTGEEDKLTGKIQACISDGIVHLVLDMKQVPFIDSAGLETLQELVPEFAKKGAELRIARLNDICRDILIATRMMGVLHIVEDVKSATESFH
ncbi:MAG: STAS domain-containing protein [Candidatus Abyssubacteria bacterium]|nr:STAS domain-containing protein [Candidatus Abyssubacteria bacterium]